MGTDDNHEYINPGDQIYSWITSNLPMVFAEFALVGVVILFSSFFLRKLKKWSLYSISGIVLFLLASIAIFFVSIIFSIIGSNGMNFFIIIPVILGLIISGPFVFLLFYLNKKSIKEILS